MVSSGTRIHDILERIQGEYLELPGLRLTRSQAQRLWHFDRGVCDALVDGARRRPVPVAHARRRVRAEAGRRGFVTSGSLSARADFIHPPGRPGRRTPACN